MFKTSGFAFKHPVDSHIVKVQFFSCMNIHHFQTRIVGTLQWNHFLNVGYIMSDIRKLFNSVDPSFFMFPIKNHSLNCCSEISEVTWKLFCQKFLMERLFCSKRTKLTMYSLVLSGSFLHSSPWQLTWMCYVQYWLCGTLKK